MIDTDFAKLTSSEKMATQIHTFEMAMTCGGCSDAARRVLKKNNVDEKDIIEVSWENKKVVVRSSLTAEELTEILKKTGKDVSHKSSQPE